MIDKIGFGVPFFDRMYGGVFRGRQTLCVGRENSGKSMLAYHFAHQGLKDDDKVLLLSNIPVKDVLILAETYGMEFANAVHSGQLTLLEYTGFLGQTDASINVMLPPDAFMELQDIIENQAISRVILDPVLPWVAIQPTTRLSEHVYSFIHAFDRLGVTSLMTIPKPVSNAAFVLKKTLEDLSPIVISTDIISPDVRTVTVTKYLGESHGLAETVKCAFVPGRGLVPWSECEPVTPAEPTIAPPPNSFVSAPQQSQPSHGPISFAAAPTAPYSTAPQPEKKSGPIRFSDVLR